MTVVPIPTSNILCVFVTASGVFVELAASNVHFLNAGIQTLFNRGHSAKTCYSRKLCKFRAIQAPTLLPSVIWGF